jgi:hypothetical protein
LATELKGLFVLPFSLGDFGDDRVGVGCQGDGRHDKEVGEFGKVLVE